MCKNIPGVEAELSYFYISTGLCSIKIEIVTCKNIPGVETERSYFYISTISILILHRPVEM
jgi:hypothetical protein